MVFFGDKQIITFNISLGPYYHPLTFNSFDLPNYSSELRKTTHTKAAVDVSSGGEFGT